MMEFPLFDDMHVHLRQGDLLRDVVPTIRKGGVGRVLVMPNLCPPITTTEDALSYWHELTNIEPNVEYFMTLYLTETTTIDEIRKAKSTGRIIGVKYYPEGVTTGSESGIKGTDFSRFFHVFAEMQSLDMSLHLHGEIKSRSVLDAEESFLVHLISIHKQFPLLRIVLEHVTTSAGVQAVRSCGDSVAATITPHHLDLTISDVVGSSFNYCKPVPKTERDREALRQVVRSKNPKFFLGSDSAPHSLESKTKGKCAAAGIFTQPYLACFLADTFDKLDCLEALKDFSCVFGAKFLRLPPRSIAESRFVLVKKMVKIPMYVGSSKIPLYRGDEIIDFSIDDYYFDC